MKPFKPELNKRTNDYATLAQLKYCGLLTNQWAEQTIKNKD